MRWGAIGSLGVLTLLFAPHARADEDDGRLRGLFGALHPELTARMMAGKALGPPESASGPMSGMGWGVRAGAAYRGFYGGLSAIDFISKGACFDGDSSGCASTSAVAYGTEVGYEVPLIPWVTVRGVLGLGDYVATYTSSSTACVGTPVCSSVTTKSQATSNNFYLDPGFLLQASLGPILLGFDVNLYIMPSASDPGANRPSAAFAALMGGAQAGITM
jgi:hypothetical protein